MNVNGCRAHRVETNHDDDKLVAMKGWLSFHSAFRVGKLRLLLKTKPAHANRVRRLKERL
jgi:hypothetical protein